MKLNYKISFVFWCWYFTLAWFSGDCQLTKIETGTTATLRDISAIGNNVMINGYFNYLSKSYNGCQSLTPLPIPGSTGKITVLQRLDLLNVYLLSFNTSKTSLYFSTDGGTVWTEKYSTGGSYSREFCFFDSTEGVMIDGSFLYRTQNGGTSWESVSSAPFSAGKDVIETFGDSLVYLGGVTVTGRGISFSTDRGKTWHSGWGIFGHEIQVKDFHFLSNDTVCSVTTKGGFILTTDGGESWNDRSGLPINNTVGVYCKNATECYVLGSDQSGKGVILKTTNLGLDWTQFDTGIHTTLLKMAALNDSIAILTGTEGVLLRWNYASTVFTGIDKKDFDSRLLVYPNPATGKICIDPNDIHAHISGMVIFNSAGKLVVVLKDVNQKQEIDLSDFSAGIYILKVQTSNGPIIRKIITTTPSKP